MRLNVFDTPLHVVSDTIGYAAIIAVFIFFALSIWHTLHAISGAKRGYSGAAFLAGLFAPSGWFTDWGNGQRKKGIRYLLFAMLAVLIAGIWVKIRSTF
jgi:hypothetical protein